MKAKIAFDARDRDITLSYQNDLLSRGPSGQLAFGLFRAQKRSSRAKDYRRGNHRRNSYAAKNDSLKYVDAVLSKWGDGMELTWGWQKDNGQDFHGWVLYVDFASFGQCSFHTQSPASDVQFPGEWDRRGTSEETILKFCGHVIESNGTRPLGVEDLMPFGKHVTKPLGELDDSYLRYLGDWEGLSSWPSVAKFIETRMSIRNESANA